MAMPRVLGDEFLEARPRHVAHLDAEVPVHARQGRHGTLQHVGVLEPVSLELQPHRQRVDDVLLRERAPDVVETCLRLQARDEPGEALAEERIQ